MPLSARVYLTQKLPRIGEYPACQSVFAELVQGFSWWSFGSPPCYVKSRANRLPIGSFTQTNTGERIRESDGTSSCCSPPLLQTAVGGGSPRGSPGENIACRAVPVCATCSLSENPFRYRLSAPKSALCRVVPRPAELCQKHYFIYGVQEVASSNLAGPIFSNDDGQRVCGRFQNRLVTDGHWPVTE